MCVASLVTLVLVLGGPSGASDLPEPSPFDGADPHIPSTAADGDSPPDSEAFYATLLSSSSQEPDQQPGRQGRGLDEDPSDEARLSFAAQGSFYNLTLHRAPNFVDPDFLVLKRYDNYTTIVQAGAGPSAPCYYWGEVRRTGEQRPGWAAVSLCGSMRGVMQVGNQSLVIEPQGERRVTRSAPTDSDGQIIGPQILRLVAGPLRPEKNTEGDPNACGTGSAAGDEEELNCDDGDSACASKVDGDIDHIGEEDVSAHDPKMRVRRETRNRHPLTIELAVYVDLPLQKQMTDLYGKHTDEEITNFVMAMVNAMELLYDDSSLERKIRFVLKRLELLKTNKAELKQQRDINAFLTSFCQWQQGQNVASDADPLHWDHAVLLTGVDLFTAADAREVNRQVVGFAPVGGMCTAASSCTVNEGKDFESVYIVAHEIGHSLGMHHDGQGNSCNAEDHIMSPTLGTGKNTWSICSRDSLDRFVATRQADCLKDSSLAVDLSNQWPDTLPGERIGADQQCRLKYGPSSSRAREQPLAELCVNLHCKYDHHRWTSHPALEGTACGYDNWCRRGQCVRRDGGGDSSAKRDGGWSSWSSATPCASSCLRGDDGSLFEGSAGVRERFRRCNSPYPRNGGAECDGSARQYETCDASALCARARRRSVSEYAHEICRQAARSDRKLSGYGVSRVTSNAFDACNIWCERRDSGLERHRQSFPDGVRCSTRPDAGSRPQFCVGGRCEAFSCDGQSLFRVGDGSSCSGGDLDRAPVDTLTAVENGLKLSPEMNVVQRDGWDDWRSYSRCRFSCTSPAKGLELVQRRCQQSPCRGLDKTVRHCEPQRDGTDCVSLRTPFEYATAVCQRYRKKLSLSQLSGIGLQLSASADDPDRPCTVTCQDRDASLRFYRVRGREGWFPSGMDCSRGEEGRTAFCLSGKCVDFAADGTPLHDSKYDYAYLFESSFRFHRVVRALRNTSRPRGTVNRAFIERVISELQLEREDVGPASSAATLPEIISVDDIDLEAPLLLARLPADFPGRHVPEPVPQPLPDPPGNALGHAFALGAPNRMVEEDERRPPTEEPYTPKQEPVWEPVPDSASSVRLSPVVMVGVGVAVMAALLW
ncbi:A disintegrin and metalloproteinase with thrombospondin motifs adt-1-like [Amphibalanus amphitrite]|uniref:A disintegrin and metalloproteinase with thrombospondin motifs adt-1-like n=1 Tax=Amphibalanus amphitrite TaxID=1232801 RepID=UPI001C90B483|nr:A disintegrin and metalloproteinase with thrombospondin motifs adt-1-like [Amphibalanus amphitrite]